MSAPTGQDENVLTVETANALLAVVDGLQMQVGIDAMALAAGQLLMGVAKDKQDAKDVVDEFRRIIDEVIDQFWDLRLAEPDCHDHIPIAALGNGSST